MKGQRIYELAKADPMALAEDVKQHFWRNGYQSHLLQQGTALVVQGKKEDILRNVLGMSYAATIIIEPTNTGFKVSVGGGKWIDKAAAAAAGLIFTGGLTTLTAGVGAAQQKALENALWQVTEIHVTQRGGRRVM